MKLGKYRLHEFLIRTLHNLLVVRTADEAAQQHLALRCPARPLGGGVRSRHEGTALDEGTQDPEGIQIETDLVLVEGDRDRRRGRGRYAGEGICDGLVVRPDERLGSP